MKPALTMKKGVLSSPALLVVVLTTLGHLAVSAEVSESSRDASASPAARLVRSPNVLIIAHRGFSARAPENTLPSFRAALETDADLVELDYYHSADNVPIVFHDKELDRTTNAVQILGRKKIPVHTETLASLQRLDAGTWFDPKFRGAQIPTLNEALDVIQQGSTALIERKNGDAATCIKLLRDKQLIPHVVVQSFDWEYVRECHQLAPDLALTALGSKQFDAKQLPKIHETGALAVGWSEKDLTPADIKAIHQRGLKVWTYTVNDAARAKVLIDWGIDGIITNDPAQIAKVVRRVAGG